VFRVSKNKAKQSSRAYIGAGCTSTMPITCTSKHNMYTVTVYRLAHTKKFSVARVGHVLIEAGSLI